MAKLSASARKALPKAVFALPKARKYPLDTENRAINAKGRATQQEQAGNLSPAQAARIRAKANVVLEKA